jgi:hypothetical protein
MATPTGGAIGGRILYYRGDRLVAGASVLLHGTPEGVDVSDAGGNYSFTDLANSTWQVAPAKSGDLGGGVSALDAAYILQVLVGKRSFDGYQNLACDVSGNGALSALDASRILQFLVGKISRFPIADTCGSDWAFVPVPAPAANQSLIQPVISTGTCQSGAIEFDPLSGQAAGQDFVAVLFGDCTGNWQPPVAGGSVSVQAPDVATGGADRPTMRSLYEP